MTTRAPSRMPHLPWNLLRTDEFSNPLTRGPRRPTVVETHKLVLSKVREIWQGEGIYARHPVATFDRCVNDARPGDSYGSGPGVTGSGSTATGFRVFHDQGPAYLPGEARGSHPLRLLP